MRPILAFAILLLALSSAAPEPEYASFVTYYLHAAGGNAVPALIEIESSIGRADRLAIASLQPHVLAVETFKAETVVASADAGSPILSADDDIVTASADSAVNNSATDTGGQASLDDLCNALYTSAQNNDLPIPFFANLIWQESRLRDDVVSSKGAMGIAQFMPETAAENGLHNPFDPMQAIPASARLLNELRLEFGNLGFVAAAYNAGVTRVVEWLEHRGSLPRETRDYVLRVTGLSIDAWRKIAVKDDAMTFVQHLPCRSLPAFASFEQAHSEQAQVEQAVLKEAELTMSAPKRHSADRQAAEHKHGGAGHERGAAHERRAVKREAEHHAHGTREKRTSA
jgi:soluble lytic murein transglycosylase-like protein